jgi:hypothetical protein
VDWVHLGKDRDQWQLYLYKYVYKFTYIFIFIYNVSVRKIIYSVISKIYFMSQGNAVTIMSVTF